MCPRNLNALPLGDKCAEQKGFIDLWWFITDGGLLVLLTWLLAQHRVYRNCAVRVFVVVENASSEVAEQAAETVRDVFRKKRILANVTVEAVILADEMIQPYTYDLTLKMDSRFGRSSQSKSDIPHSLDELFMQPTEALVEPSTESATNQQEPRKNKFRRMLSRALHPKRNRKIESTQSIQSVSEAFNRRGTITEDTERDLLDTLNLRCQERRQQMNEELGVEDEEDEEECESVLGELVTQQSSQGNVFARLNQVITSRSADSSLVLMNLPDVWGTKPEDCASYLAYCECLVKGLEKVVFVHSSGTEVVRIF